MKKIVIVLSVLLTMIACGGEEDKRPPEDVYFAETLCSKIQACGKEIGVEFDSYENCYKETLNVMYDGESYECTDCLKALGNCEIMQSTGQQKCRKICNWDD